ncbi:MAG: class I SAM-dependent methyltransferase [Thermodesulfobacteriota bacterium]
MSTDKINRIKDAVRANFDDSPEQYQDFEEATGFFRALNSALLGEMGVGDNCRILDVGCGTGASTRHMLDHIPHCRVWALDISPRMLETARRLVGESERVRFVEGDGARLTEYFDTRFDAVVYSASVFLIPDYRESLRQARELLGPGGRIGLTFMDGLYGPEDENLVSKANEQAQIGASLRRPVQIGDFLEDFGSDFPEHRVWVEDFHQPHEQLRGFFSVPAMSAGLFPGLAYEQRVRKVNELFDFLRDTPIRFRWRLIVGTKPR